MFIGSCSEAGDEIAILINDEIIHITRVCQEDPLFLLLFSLWPTLCLHNVSIEPMGQHSRHCSALDPRGTHLEYADDTLI
jgi:hypothetical protein